LPNVDFRKLVVFAGSSMPEDDKKILTLINRVREETPRQGTSQDLAWRYRPHPAPQHAVSDFADSFPDFEFTNHISLTDKIRWPSLDTSAVELAITNRRFNSNFAWAAIKDLITICQVTTQLITHCLCRRWRNDSKTIRAWCSNSLTDKLSMCIKQS
jgi:hypothetical protein